MAEYESKIVLEEELSETKREGFSLSAVGTPSSAASGYPTMSFSFQGSPDLSDPEKTSFSAASLTVSKRTQSGVISNESHESLLSEDQSAGIEHFWGRQASISIPELGFQRSYGVMFVVRENGADSEFGQFKDGLGEFSYSHSDATRDFTFEMSKISGFSSITEWTYAKMSISGTETYEASWKTRKEIELIDENGLFKAYIGKYPDFSPIKIRVSTKSTPERKNGYNSQGGTDFESYGPSRVYTASAAAARFASGIPTGTAYLVKYDYSESRGLSMSVDAIGLAGGDGKFSNVSRMQICDRGAELRASDVAASIGGSLTYADGETIGLDLVQKPSGTSISAAFGGEYAGRESVFIDEISYYGGGIPVTVTIPTVAFGTLEMQYSIQVRQIDVSSWRIEGQRTSFSYMENLAYGENAKAIIVDSDGNEEEHRLADLIADGLVVASPKIGTPAQEGPQTIATELSGVSEYEYLAYAPKCQNLSLSRTQFDAVYAEANSTIDILAQVSDIEATYGRYDYEGGEETFSRITASPSEISWSPSSHVLTADEDVAVTASVTASNGKTLERTIRIPVRERKAESLGVVWSDSGNEVYYRGRNNSFKLPTSSSFTLRYNDGTTQTVPYASVSFYTNSQCVGEPLSAGDEIPSSQILIYCRYSSFTSSYEIPYTEDSITDISLSSPFVFVLGNRFSKYREDGTLSLVATYESGAEEEIDDWAFSKDGYPTPPAIVLASSDGQSFEATHQGKAWNIDTSGCTFLNPGISEVSVSGGKDEYINGVDAVDFREVSAIIVYEDSEYVEKAKLSQTNDAVSGFFSVAYVGAKGEITEFAGTQTFSINEFDQTNREDAKFVLTVKSRYDASESASADMPISIINSGPYQRITLHNLTRDYQVGDDFLGAGCPDEARLYYGGSDFECVSVRLCSDSSLVRVEPNAVGTKLTNASDYTQVTVRLSSDPSKYQTYSYRVLPKGYLAEAVSHEMVAVWEEGESISCNDGENEIEGEPLADGRVGRYVLVPESDTTASYGARSFLDGRSLANVRCFGYLDGIFDEDNAANVVLFDDFTPLVDGEANATVTFPCYAAGNASLIDRCRIAKLFGNANAKNRVFVSGNPDMPNCDWHSGPVNEYMQQGETMESNGDFTYFSDRDYCFYGQTDNDVVGYDIVSTDRMVVLKSKSKKEPTNYFRTSGITQAIDGGGNAKTDLQGNALYMESFGLASGNVGQGAMNPKAVCNMNGDTLFVTSDNEVAGLDISGQVGDSQRIANSRSRRIDPELKKLDLSDSILWTDNRYLFLCAEDACYVTNYETLSAEDGQYEWFRISVGGITAMAEIGDSIVFGRKDGSIHRFERGVYRDCERIFAGAGGTSVGIPSDSADTIAFSSDIASLLEEDGEYTFSVAPRDGAQTSELAFRKIASIDGLTLQSSDEGLLIVADDADECVRLEDELGAEGAVFYFSREKPTDTWQQTGNLREWEPYTLMLRDRTELGDSNAYAVIDQLGNEVSLSDIGAIKICRALDEQYDVSDLDIENQTFKLKRNGRYVDITTYGSSSAVPSLRSIIHSHRNVKAYFICGANPMGSLGYRKTIWSWTVTAFGDNELEICQATNAKNLGNMLEMGFLKLGFSDRSPTGVSFRDIGFGSLDLEKIVTPRKYTYVRPISAPFICFAFRSESAIESVLDYVSVVYSVPMHGFGRD